MSVLPEARDLWQPSLTHISLSVGPAPRPTAGWLRVQSACNIGRVPTVTDGLRTSIADPGCLVCQSAFTLVSASLAGDGAGGQGQGRTADLPLFRRTLIPTELPDLAGAQ
jgi:hypothetical protein